jgi:hypothetical protein
MLASNTHLAGLGVHGEGGIALRAAHDVAIRVEANAARRVAASGGGGRDRWVATPELCAAGVDLRAHAKWGRACIVGGER